MTLITVSIIAIVAASLILVGLIVSALHADTVDSRIQADITRIQGMFDQPGDFATPEARRIPGATVTADLGEPNTEQIQAPPLEVLERLHAGLTRPLNAELAIAEAQRAAKARPGPYRPRHAGPGEDTQVFQALVDTTWTSDERAALLNGPDWKCESCTTGRDGEPPHTSCVGCSCRCGDSQGAQIIPLGNPARLERRAA